MKDIRNLFKLEKENKAIKEKVIEDIKTPFEQQEEQYRPSRVGNFWDNNYYFNADRNKNLSIK